MYSTITVLNFAHNSEQQLVEKALRTRQTTDTFPANFMRRVRMRLSPEVMTMFCVYRKQ
jgi:hypothetical protein